MIWQGSCQGSPWSTLCFKNSLRAQMQSTTLIGILVSRCFLCESVCVVFLFLLWSSQRSNSLQVLPASSKFPDNSKCKRNHTPVSHVLIYLLNSKFAWLKRILFGVSFSGGICIFLCSHEQKGDQNTSSSIRGLIILECFSSEAKSSFAPSVRKNCCTLNLVK